MDLEIVLGSSGRIVLIAGDEAIRGRIAHILNQHSRDFGIVTALAGIVPKLRGLYGVAFAVAFAVVVVLFGDVFNLSPATKWSLIGIYLALLAFILSCGVFEHDVGYGAWSQVYLIPRKEKPKNILVRNKDQIALIVFGGVIGATITLAVSHVTTPSPDIPAKTTGKTSTKTTDTKP